MSNESHVHVVLFSAHSVQLQDNYLFLWWEVCIGPVAVRSVVVQCCILLNLLKWFIYRFIWFTGDVIYSLTKRFTDLGSLNLRFFEMNLLGWIQMILCQNDSVIQECHQLFTCITVPSSDSSVCLVQLHIAASKITHLVY